MLDQYDNKRSAPCAIHGDDPTGIHCPHVFQFPGLHECLDGEPSRSKKTNRRQRHELITNHCQRTPRAKGPEEEGGVARGTIDRAHRFTCRNIGPLRYPAITAFRLPCKKSLTT